MYKILDIYWERVNLHLKTDKKIEAKAYLRSKESCIALTTKNNEIIINITNTPEGTMLDKGIWQIFINDEILKVDKNLIERLDDKSRIFPYRKDFYVYIVRFLIDDNDLILKIKTDFMMENKKPKNNFRFNEARDYKEFINILFRKIAIVFLNVLYKSINFFKNKNNILLLTENSSALSSNLKYIKKDLVNYNYNILEYTKNKYNDRFTVLDYIKEVFLIAKSKIIIIDNYTSILTFLNLSKNTKVIQLWHAGVGFKAVGYARFGKPGSPHPYISSHRKYDFAIVNSDEMIDIYKEVFGCKSEVFAKCCSPRLLNYLNEKQVKQVTNNILENNKILKDKKIILFSPTYRGIGSKNAFYDYSQIDLDKIANFCQKNNFVFIVKMHPFIKEKIIINEKNKNYILDLSNYEINDLIYISDIMITDYSSCAYEFSFFNRPLILFRYDKILYEYLRPIHTIDSIFNNKYEVSTFTELLNILNTLKDIDIKNRFKNIKKITNNINICDIISEKF